MNMEGEYDGIRFVRNSFYDRGKKLHITEFMIERGNKKFFERHIQRIYKISEIESAIDSSGLFRVVGCFDGFSGRAGSESSDRVHFLLRKIAGEDG